MGSSQDTKKKQEKHQQMLNVSELVSLKMMSSFINMKWLLGLNNILVQVYQHNSNKIYKSSETASVLQTIFVFLLLTEVYDSLAAHQQLHSKSLAITQNIYLF